MATQIELLAALQSLDSELREKTSAVEEGEQRVALLEESMRSKGAAAATAREQSQSLAARQRDLEGRLAAAESKLKDRRMRITRIRNEKELGLARREVDLLKEEVGGLETELVALLEQGEAAQAVLGGLEDELGKLQAAMETEMGALRAMVARLGGEIERERGLRQRMLADLDEDLGRRYETILARRGGRAVVEVRDGTCQGCHMHVPPQLFIQIQRNSDVILCPNCQRILYVRRESGEGG